MTIEELKSTITIPMALRMFAPGYELPNRGNGKSPFYAGSGSHVFYISPDGRFFADFSKPVDDNHRGYASGDVVDLIRYLFNVGTPEAINILKKATGGNAPLKASYQEVKRREATSLSREQLDMAYKVFLSYAKLDKKARKALSDRGLDEKEIAYYNFSAFPFDSTMKQISKELTDLGIDGNSVPGFFTPKKTKDVTFKRQDGIIIPIKTVFGTIEGLLIRLYDPKDGPRYIWFSSKNMTTKTCLYDGKSPGTPLAFVDRIVKNKKSLFITEGMFKAIAINKCFGCPVFSVQGVGNFRGIEKHLEESMKKYPTERIIIAYDSDFIGNISVTANAIKLYQTLHQAFPDVKYDYALWDPSLGKGIDDLITNVGGYSGHISTIGMKDFTDAYKNIENECQKLALEGNKAEIQNLMLGEIKKKQER